MLHSSLLGPFISYDENEVMWLQALKTFLGHNLVCSIVHLWSYLQYSVLKVEHKYLNLVEISIIDKQCDQKIE